MTHHNSKFKWIWAVAVTAFTVLLIRTFALTWCLIPSTGMENTLYQGERILVNKWSYGLRMPGMNWWGYHRINPHPAGRGDVIVFNNPGELKIKSPDQRELFISRCIGLPGDTIWVDSLFTVLSDLSIHVPDRKILYTYHVEHSLLIDSLLAVTGLTDSRIMGTDSARITRGLSRYEYYLLTQEHDSIQTWMVPQDGNTVTHAYPIIIPGKNVRVDVTPHNRTLLLNTLLAHEHQHAELINDTLYINGKAVSSCQFGKDYYWMASDNSVNFCDSRLFGLVPDDHIIGKASWIWFSKEQGSNLFSGYRWNRWFTTIQ